MRLAIFRTLTSKSNSCCGYRPVIITVLLIGIGLSGDDDRRIVCGSLAAWQYGKPKRENTQGCCPLNLLVGAQQHVCQTAVTLLSHERYFWLTRDFKNTFPRAATNPARSLFSGWR